MKNSADLGLIGLAVMGENLILNMESRGFTIACFNRTVEKVDLFVNGRGKGKSLIGCRSLEELVGNLKKPRKVMLMVRAGNAIDELLNSLIPMLDEGDIIIDGGNSFYEDTMRRCKLAEDHRLLFVGAGVSGGEEGALHGPSIMPGGNHKAWAELKPVFQTIAAKIDNDIPCCEWVGPSGSGHFVKMVHNGIEYGDMQLICEAYHLMSQGLSMSAAEMHEVFSEWNRTELNSYLVEITAEIMSKKEAETQKPLLDFILDVAGQKGTGKWTSQCGLEMGVAIPQIAEAVFARCLAASKDERLAANLVLPGPEIKYAGNKSMFLKELKTAVYAAKICSYAQGFQLLRAASIENKWQLNFGEIALMWRGGCIIRASFLDDIKEAFDSEPQLANLLVSPFFTEIVSAAQDSWRNVVKTAIDLGIPTPAFSSALTYYDGYRCARLPANLLQAQRDYFGAHTYERVDMSRGQFFHTNWTEKEDSQS